MALTRRNARLAAILTGIAVAGAPAAGTAGASAAPREELFVNPSTGYVTAAPAAAEQSMSTPRPALHQSRTRPRPTPSPRPARSSRHPPLRRRTGSTGARPGSVRRRRWTGARAACCHWPHSASEGSREQQAGGLGAAVPARRCPGAMCAIAHIADRRHASVYMDRWTSTAQAKATPSGCSRSSPIRSRSGAGRPSSSTSTTWRAAASPAGTRTKVSGRLAGVPVTFDVEVHAADADRLELSADGPIGLDVRYDSPARTTGPR